MALADIIKQTVTAASGNVNIPSNVKDKVLGGLSESILGSFTQTATKAGGIDQIKQLITGKASAASSPLTSLATQLFTSNILGKLNLGSSTNNALSGLIPSIMTKVSGLFKDKDGDGDVDINDILLTLKGGSASKGASILGAATSILGGMLKKK